MKEYELGPNGAILTCLNLFATRVDQFLGLLQERRSEVTHYLIDTPGQIEAFTWSASGSVLTQSLSSHFPTIILYIVDTPRCVSSASFMSNMLYACSVLTRSQLPFVLVFNKTDLHSAKQCQEWMQDYESFADYTENDESYMAGWSRSMALVLEALYQTVPSVGVSSFTQEGMSELEEALRVAEQLYFQSTFVEWQEKWSKHQADLERTQAVERAKVKKDMTSS
mgnify:CR=1 FL=1|jgi:GPN-loop GTPase